MSYQTVQWVLRHSPARGAARLVLVVLAQYAERDGSSAHPGIDTIVGQAQCSERSVQYALRALEDAGCIRLTGRRPSGTAVWQVLTTDAAAAAVIPRPARSQVAPHAVQPATESVSQVAPDQSLINQGSTMEGGGRRNGAGAQRAPGLQALCSAGRHLSQHPALSGGGAG